MLESKSQKVLARRRVFLRFIPPFQAAEQASKASQKSAERQRSFGEEVESLRKDLEEDLQTAQQRREKAEVFPLGLCIQSTPSLGRTHCQGTTREPARP